MQYRQLTTEELHQLEKPFVQFLAANGIPAADWEKMRTEQPERALETIRIFSDFIFDETLRKVEYLQMREPTEFRVFRCKAETIELIGLSARPESGVNFLEIDDILAFLSAPTEGVSIYSAEKPYKPAREAEIFRMVESGCRITDATVFDVLSKMRGKRKQPD